MESAVSHSDRRYFRYPTNLKKRSEQACQKYDEEKLVPILRTCLKINSPIPTSSLIRFKVRSSCRYHRLDDLRVKVCDGTHNAYTCVLLCVTKYCPSCMVQTIYPMLFVSSRGFVCKLRIGVGLIGSGHQAKTTGSINC